MIRPADPEAGIEFNRLADIVDRFILQSDAGQEIAAHEPPHLAQRVPFNHARQLELGVKIPNHSPLAFQRAFDPLTGIAIQHLDGLLCSV